MIMLQLYVLLMSDLRDCRKACSSPLPDEVLEVSKVGQDPVEPFQDRVVLLKKLQTHVCTQNLSRIVILVI